MFIFKLSFGWRVEIKVVLLLYFTHLRLILYQSPNSSLWLGTKSENNNPDVVLFIYWIILKPFSFFCFFFCFSFWCCYFSPLHYFKRGSLCRINRVQKWKRVDALGRIFCGSFVLHRCGNSHTKILFISIYLSIYLVRYKDTDTDRQIKKNE